MFNSVSELSNFDTVIIDDIILKKISDRFEDSDEMIPFKGILKEGVIKNTYFDIDTVGYIYFKELDSHKVELHNYIFHKKKKKLLNLFTAVFVYEETTDKAGERIQNLKYSHEYALRETKEHREITLRTTEATYMAVFGYIHLLQKNKKTVIKYVDNKPSSNTSHSTNKTKPKRNLIEIDDITVVVVKEDSNIVKFLRKYHRTMESWGVRGYYRKLKSGKQVFVKAHTKGTKKNITHKDYNIKEDEHDN